MVCGKGQRERVMVCRYVCVCEWVSVSELWKGKAPLKLTCSNPCRYVTFLSFIHSFFHSPAPPFLPPSAARGSALNSQLHLCVRAWARVCVCIGLLRHGIRNTAGLISLLKWGCSVIQTQANFVLVFFITLFKYYPQQRWERQLQLAAETHIAFCMKLKRSSAVKLMEGSARLQEA